MRIRGILILQAISSNYLASSCHRAFKEHEVIKADRRGAPEVLQRCRDVDRRAWERGRDPSGEIKRPVGTFCVAMLLLGVDMVYLSNRFSPDTTKNPFQSSSNTISPPTSIYSSVNGKTTSCDFDDTRVPFRPFECFLSAQSVCLIDERAIPIYYE